MKSKKNPYITPEDSAAQIPSEAPCYLLPCPFCGEDDPEIEWGDDDILHRCRKCGTKGPSTWYEDGFLDIHGNVIEPDAETNNQKKWNTRVTEGERVKAVECGLLEVDLEANWAKFLIPPKVMKKGFHAGSATIDFAGVQ